MAEMYPKDIKRLEWAVKLSLCAPVVECFGEIVAKRKSQIGGVSSNDTTASSSS